MAASPADPSWWLLGMEQGHSPIPTVRPPPRGAPAHDCRVVWAVASCKRCGKSCGQDQELPACAKCVRPEKALTWGAGGGLGTAGEGPDLQPWPRDSRQHRRGTSCNSLPSQPLGYRLTMALSCRCSPANPSPAPAALGALVLPWWSSSRAPGTGRAARQAKPFPLQRVRSDRAGFHPQLTAGIPCTKH